MSRIVVFAGPSLPDPPVQEADGLSFELRPPAAQGDVLQAALPGPSAIVLIDGYFHGVPAVFHKEILWALSEDIPVYGASSMGALRAAELHPFGMVGVGKVFERYQSGETDQDDEVALVHAPAELGYTNLSDPLVNIRATLDAAMTADVLSEDEARRALAEVAALHYPDRTRDALLKLIANADFAQWIDAGNWVDQKRLDALSCLDRVRADHANGALPERPGFVFRHTDAFQSLIRDIASRLAPAEALDMLSLLDPAEFEARQTQAIVETLAINLARTHPASDGPETMLQAVTEFRSREHLPDAESLAAWLNARKSDVDELSRHLDIQVKTAQQISRLQPEILSRILVGLKMDGKLSD